MQVHKADKSHDNFLRLHFISGCLFRNFFNNKNANKQFLMFWLLDFSSKN